MFLFLFGYFGAGVLLYLFNDIVRWSPTWMLAALVRLERVNVHQHHEDHAARQINPVRQVDPGSERR